MLVNAKFYEGNPNFAIPMKTAEKLERNTVKYLLNSCLPRKKEAMTVMITGGELLVLNLLDVFKPKNHH